MCYGYMIYALFATQLYMPYVYSIDCLTTGDCQYNYGTWL